MLNNARRIKELIDITMIRNMFSEAGLKTIVTMVYPVLINIISFFGIPFFQVMFLKMKDIKNRGAIKYIVTYKIQNRSISDSLRKIFVFYLEVFWIIISAVLVLISFGIAIVYTNILQKGMEKYYLAILVSAFIVGSLIIFIEKKVTHKISKSLPVVLAVWVSLGIILLSVITLNQRIMFFAMLVSTLLMNGAIILSLQINNWYMDYKEKKKNYCRVIRYILIAVWVSNCYSQFELTNGWNSSMYDMVLILYLVLACVEYFMMEVGDEIGCAEITIHTKEGDKVTKDKIIYYYGDKVKYVLDDGTEEIIDVDLIDRITCIQKHPSFKSGSEQNRVECFLKNGDIKEYSYYRLKNDKWILFSKCTDGARESMLLKTEDVKKVVEYNHKSPKKSWLLGVHK